MAADISRAGVEKAYGRWAPVYDLVFGKVFDAGRQSTIAEADRIGGRILDVGVGTGLSLSDYSRTTKICGVDISEPMLRKAQARVHALRLSNVEVLSVMDAKNLAFPENFFDAVVAQYVITAVPDPEGTLDEFVRVLKPGGELILVNHIGAESGPAQIVRARLRPHRPPPRLAAGIPVGPPRQLGRQAPRRHARRAPSDAADGALFADPLRQIVSVICGDRAVSRHCLRKTRPHPEEPASGGRLEGSAAGKPPANFQRFNSPCVGRNLRMAGDVSLPCARHQTSSWPAS
ncbi:SAM-dependent methyltransferase [Bradyrhizobium sp. i1.4.4]